MAAVTQKNIAELARHIVAVVAEVGTPANVLGRDAMPPAVASRIGTRHLDKLNQALFPHGLKVFDAVSDCYHIVRTTDARRAGASWR